MHSTEILEMTNNINILLILCETWNDEDCQRFKFANSSECISWNLKWWYLWNEMRFKFANSSWVHFLFALYLVFSLVCSPVAILGTAMQFNMAVFSRCSFCLCWHWNQIYLWPMMILSLFQSLGTWEDPVHELVRAYLSGSGSVEITSVSGCQYGQIT